ncbi:MAG: PorV/PorQ family protein [Flavobacteriales bacterium]
MKRHLIILFAGALLLTPNVQAGNEDRAGSAGATELLINPWARSSGWGSAGIASSRGLEATFLNVAGLAYVDKTEIMFTRTNWMGQAAGIGINGVGLAQKVGETGALAISVMTMNLGDIMVTTTERPEGGLGVFRPTFANFAVAYAKQFSESISGGVNVKVVSQSISNLKAQGVALDAGVRYVTGENDQIKFAISLKNVGAPMKYSGDGLSITSQNTFSGMISTTQQQVSPFELPSLVHIGASYDFLLSEKSKLTAAGCYTSNSFTRDQYRLGLEYGMTSDKIVFSLRAGLEYEKGLFSATERATAMSGPSAGFSIDFPSGKNKSLIGIDYTVRITNPFGPVHSVGARIDVK